MGQEGRKVSAAAAAAARHQGDTTTAWRSRGTAHSNPLEDSSSSPPPRLLLTSSSPPTLAFPHSPLPSQRRHQECDAELPHSSLPHQLAGCCCSCGSPHCLVVICAPSWITAAVHQMGGGGNLVCVAQVGHEARRTTTRDAGTIGSFWQMGVH